MEIIKYEVTRKEFLKIFPNIFKRNKGQIFSKHFKNLFDRPDERRYERPFATLRTAPTVREAHNPPMKSKDCHVKLKKTINFLSRSKKSKVKIWIFPN